MYPDYFCLLLKYIYGRRQSPRVWFVKLSRCLVPLGFRYNKADSSLFIFSHHGTVVFLLVYVDDLILTGNSPSFISRLIHPLNKEFAVKDLGTLK